MMTGRRVSNGPYACMLLCVSPFCPGANYSNILIPSERMSIRHAGTTTTLRTLAIVRKIIYLTKSEILYRECSGNGEGGGDTAAELYAMVLSLHPSLPHPHTL